MNPYPVPIAYLAGMRRVCDRYIPWVPWGSEEWWDGAGWRRGILKSLQTSILDSPLVKDWWSQEVPMSREARTRGVGVPAASLVERKPKSRVLPLSYWGQLSLKKI